MTMSLADGLEIPLIQPDGKIAADVVPGVTLPLLQWDGAGSVPARPVDGEPVQWVCPVEPGAAGATLVSGDQWRLG